MVREVVPADVAAQLQQDPKQLLLLDVREPWERELAVIEPSLHIPMQEVPGRLEEIPKGRSIVVYCHTGVRSLMVAGFLEEHGFGPLASLAGGIDCWSIEVDPDVPRYG